MKKQQEYYGHELTLDLYGCNLAIISSKKKLAEYAVKLCKIIKMKRYGQPFIPFFGVKKPKTEGYSLVQLIETSSITGHFSNNWLAAYINIFSCKDFDANKAASFTKAFFGAQKMTKRLVIRK
ncbi:MAG: S-adenosylmethionine decarboxylase [Candidatus Portnoybacteria bacterium]|nr:S-adenosylmethionine decarboxylase [Candidatus Portnoybacteria bacterium]